MGHPVTAKFAKVIVLLAPQDLGPLAFEPLLDSKVGGHRTPISRIMVYDAYIL